MIHIVKNVGFVRGGGDYDELNSTAISLYLSGLLFERHTTVLVKPPHLPAQATRQGCRHGRKGQSM